MTDIPDIKVWLALTDANHQHHKSAQDYWQNQSANAVGFNRVTILGFLRLCTHPKVLSMPLSPDKAWSIYQRYRNDYGIRFLPEPALIEATFRSLTSLSEFPRSQWTDAYLAAFAATANCRLVSFDADFAPYSASIPLEFLHLS